MSKYTLWDVSSSSLLLETRELHAIADSTARFVSDNGEEALDDLMLGIEPDGTLPAHDYSGRHILEAIEREQGALNTARA